MSGRRENPFDRFDLDPCSSVAAITEHMRELALALTGPERETVQSAWEDLTLHPRARVEAALSTFVDPSPPSVVRPAPPAREPSDASPQPVFGFAIAAVHAALGPHDDGALSSAALAHESDPLLEELRR